VRSLPVWKNSIHLLVVASEVRYQARQYSLHFMDGMGLSIWVVAFPIVCLSFWEVEYDRPLLNPFNISEKTFPDWNHVVAVRSLPVLMSRSVCVADWLQNWLVYKWAGSFTNRQFYKPVGWLVNWLTNFDKPQWINNLAGWFINWSTNGTYISGLVHEKLGAREDGSWQHTCKYFMQ